MKKLISATIALLMIASMSITSFATRGYPNELEKPDNTASEQLKNDAIDKAFSDTIKDEGPQIAKVELKNVQELTPEDIKKVVEASKKNNVDTVIQADKVEGNKVIGRFYIDPQKAAEIKEPINFGIATDNSITRSTFEKFFENDIAIASLAQQKTFGFEVNIAVKLDLSKLDTSKKLCFYSYDKATNSYSAMYNVSYFIDANGYIHFGTVKAGDIIISSSPLKLATK